MKQFAFVLDRNDSGSLESLNDYLRKGWIVKSTTAFVPHMGAAVGFPDRGSILVILEK